MPTPPTSDELAAEFLEELAATRWDIDAFARLLGVEPHEGQHRFWLAMLQRDPGGVHPMWLNIMLAAGNRAGKTSGLAIAILHHAFHKMGLPPPDGTTEGAEKWQKHPWNWYHFGVQQEIADLVWQEIDMLVNEVHPAQKGKGSKLIKYLGKHLITTDKKERGEYRWVKLDPVLGGAQIHFRTTNEKAIGQLGKDMHGISYDECGFDPNLQFIVNEVLHFRRLSTAGPLILIATPSESFQQFPDEWEKGNPESPDRVPYHYSVRMSTRDNVGHGIDKTSFERLVASMPPHLIPQNVDGFFIEGRNAFFNAQAVELCFDKKLEEEQAPLPKHVYVQGVDPALTHDATWSIVLDYTVPDRIMGTKATRREGKQSLPKLVALITTTHGIYNVGKSRCLTACDTSGFGGKVFKEQLSDIHPFRAVEFGGVKSRKQKLLTDLKGYIEKGWLKFPKSGPWLELRRQLLAYRLDDRNLKTDAVMALAVAVKQLVQHASMSDWAESQPFDAYDESPVSVGAEVYPEHRHDMMAGTDKVSRRIRAHYE